METNKTTTLRGEQIITLDMDGTMYDSWACCGERDGFVGSAECAHLREDTLRRVRNLQVAFPEARLAVLSWRSGLYRQTKTWLERVGLADEIAAYFIPGAPDDVSGPWMAEARRFASQVRFKAATVMALQAADNEIVAGFDDNGGVVDALRSLGVPELQAPRLVQIETWEWQAGYIGAPKPVPDVEAWGDTAWRRETTAA